MNIVLIRHTRVNVEKGTCYGQTEVELDSGYGLEFELISGKINNDIFDIIYSSPLLRCKMLAKGIFQKEEINYDKRLMEMNFGDWEGLLWDNISKTPEANVFFNNYLDTSCPNGESFKDLINRISEFYIDLKSKHPDKKVAIITHGGPIRALLSIIEGISPQQSFEREINYGEVVRLSCK